MQRWKCICLPSSRERFLFVVDSITTDIPQTHNTNTTRVYAFNIIVRSSSQLQRTTIVLNLALFLDQKEKKIRGWPPPHPDVLERLTVIGALYSARSPLVIDKI